MLTTIFCFRLKLNAGSREGFFSTFAIVYMFLTVPQFKNLAFFPLKRETHQRITLYVCSVECFSNILCKQKFFCFCLKLNGRSNKFFFYSTFVIVYMLLTVSAISSVAYLNRCNGAFQATADSRQITSFKARKFSLDKVSK